jgi:hypothetical protein
MQLWRQSVMLAALSGLLAASASAQLRPATPPSISTGLSADASSPSPSTNQPSMAPPFPSLFAASNPSFESSLSSSESCNSWTEAGFHSPTVSAARLLVPGKASGEYQKACGALKDRKLDQAEEHVRKALDTYADYAAAWVMLGQILEGKQKHAEARQACSQAMRIDSNYVPPYLCLADFAAREGDWDQVSVLADRAQTLDPVSNPFTFYFTAGVQLHFRQLRQAENNAELALKLDVWHHMPELYYLMAQICQAKGDLRNEAVELRQYLKVAPKAMNAEQAKTLLAQIDVKLPK